MKLKETCYLCGATENLTVDHVPPEGFFPPGSVHKYLTVPACEACNSGMSKDDEAFRLWVTAAAARSDHGAWIWKNKVIPSFQTRNKKLVKNLVPFFGRKTIKTPIGEVEVDTFSIPTARANNFLIRVTKAMLWLRYTGMEFRDLIFQVVPLPPTPDSQRFIKEIAPYLALYTVASGVFRYGIAAVQSYPQNGVVVLEFFNAAGFAVFYGWEEVEKMKDYGYSVQ